MENITLSIIIVHFNTPDLLRNCLNSIYNAKKREDIWEVIVVDNGSSEEIVKQLEIFEKIDQFKSFVSIIYNKQNEGFSKGNNIGMAQAKGEYILLLNSDTEIQNEAIQKTLCVFEHSSVGAATCKLVLPNGNIDPACHRGFPTPWAAFTYFIGIEYMFPFSRLFSQYHQWYKNLAYTHDIDLPSGAFFLVRREILNTVGTLDEDFFMYGEDIDWAFRIKKKGYRILFVPDGLVLHRKKQSGRESNQNEMRKKTDVFFYETMKLFYKKHYQDVYPKMLMWFIFFLIDVRIKMV